MAAKKSPFGTPPTRPPPSRSGSGTPLNSPVMKRAKLKQKR